MYDPRENRFVPIKEEEVEQHQREGRVVFTVGETITIRGVELVVFNVTDTNIILRPRKGQRAIKAA
jgi:hypothetical protein